MVTVPLAGLTPAARADDLPAGQTVVGTVVRAYVEHRDQQDAGARTDYGAPVTYVDSGIGSPVRVPTPALADVPVGATVAVTVGATVSDSPTVADNLDPAQQVLSASVLAPAGPSTAPDTPGVTDSVSIAMVTPAGDSPDSTTLATVVSQVSGPVAQFWAEQSNGAVRVAVADTHDWASTSVTEDCSDPEGLWDDVARQIGWTRGAGKHLLLYLPHTDPRCAYGLAEVGAGLHAGGYAYVTDTPTSVIAHELGHNFGLLHSGSLECDGAVEGGTCDTQEYGDLYDVMGASWSQVGSLNAVQSARLGFLPSGQVQPVAATDSDGSYQLAALSGTTGTRAIRLTSSSGRVYYLEYRAATGRDSYLTGDPTVNYAGPPGVLLHRVETDDPADSSMLLDGTPTSGSGFANDGNDVFPIGVPVSVAGGQFRITVSNPTASGVELAVTTPDATVLAAGAAITSAYRGASGTLGSDVTGVLCGLAQGGCYALYQGGSIYWTRGSGAHVVRGAIRAAWQALGAEWSRLGYPTSDETYANGGSWQQFQNGRIYWSGGTGAHAVSGEQLTAYTALGGSTGSVGYPRTDVQCGLVRSGCYQIFTGGTLYTTAATGTHLVRGAIRAAWQGLGAEWSRLGYPTSDETYANGGSSQQFENGSISWTPTGGVRF